MPRSLARVTLALISLTTASASAQPVVRFELEPSADRVANALGVDRGGLQRQLDSEVRALYGLLELGELLRVSANAQALVSAGIGADYASNPDGFFFGFGVNAALDPGDAEPFDANFEVSRDVPVAAGVMLTLMAGYNFADQGLPWLTASVHGMHFPMTVDQLDGEFTNLGAHLQTKLFAQSSEGFNPVHWGGIDLTTGFTYGRSTLSLTETYEATTLLADGVELQTLSVGTMVFEQTAYTIPFEVTTNLTLFEILTFYGGVGVDIPLGNARTEFDLETDLEGRLGGERVPIGTATIEANEEVGADDLLPRFMAGIQANMWILRAFVQLSVSTRDSALGLATGLRVTF